MWETNEIILGLFLLAFPMLLLLVAFVMRRYSVEPWIIRKYVHSIGLVTAGLYGAFLDSLIDILAIVIILVSIVLLLSLPKIRFLQQLTEMASREGEDPKILMINGFATSAAVVSLIIIFWQTKWIFLASVYCVAIGDALGEFIGKPFGKYKYRIFLQKSIEGSLGVFFGSLFGGVVALLLFEIFSTHLFLIVLGASLLVTLIEAASVLFIDNLLMPLAYAFILWYFS